MKDSADKRMQDAKTVTSKEVMLADAETVLQEHKDHLHAGVKEMQALEKLIQALHSECDFVVKYHSMRKEAREGTLDSLRKSKALISGADLSLLGSAVAQNSSSHLHDHKGTGFE